MNDLFLTVLNMSLTGAFVIVIICIARLPLKKAPKMISYGLWAVAGFRLIFPFSFESVVSLIPFGSQPISQDIVLQPVPNIDSGIPIVNETVSNVLPAVTPEYSANPVQSWLTVAAVIWLVGLIVMVVYGVISYLVLKRKMNSAVNIEKNIFESCNIKSPFVLGIIDPKIYLPVGLSEMERDYILLHEQTHISRRDHIIKFIAYFILCLHWFNPLAWTAFFLMGVDMEMSCDERVLKEASGDTKKIYSMSLLSMATDRRIIGGSPLAFGEGGVKERIKNVLNYKKPSKIVLVVAIAAAAIVVVGLAADRNMPAAWEDLLSQTAQKEEYIELVSISSDKDQEFLEFKYNKTRDTYDQVQFWIEYYEYGELVRKAMGIDSVEAWPLGGKVSLAVTDAADFVCQFIIMDTPSSGIAKNTDPYWINDYDALRGLFIPEMSPVPIEHGKEIVLYASVYAYDNPAINLDLQNYAEDIEMFRKMPYIQIVKCRFDDKETSAEHEKNENGLPMAPTYTMN